MRGAAVRCVVKGLSCSNIVALLSSFVILLVCGTLCWFRDQSDNLSACFFHVLRLTDLTFDQAFVTASAADNVQKISESRK